MTDSIQTNNSAANQQKRKKVMGIFVVTVATLGVVYGAYHFAIGRYGEDTDNAYVAGDMVTVSAQITGNVKAVLVDDNQTVQAGQTLVTLDDTDAQLALTQATAQLADTVRTVRSLYDQVNINRAGQSAKQSDIIRSQEEVSRLEIEAKRLSSELSRREAAYKQGAVSAEELEHAQSALTQAATLLSSAKAAQAQSQAGFVQAQATLNSSLNQTRDTQVADHPKVQQAVAKVREAFINAQRATIVAPIGGQVAKRSAQVGTRVAPGAALLTIIPLEKIWVDANFKESQLARIRVGQTVQLHADVYGSGVTYHGKVLGLSAGTGSAFSLLPAQNATGNWIKIVQRVPVRIAVDADDLKKAPLRVGLSMRAEVDTHNTDGPLVASATTGAGRQTQVYDDLATQADLYAAKILSKELGS